MDRRGYLGAVVSVGSIALTGCSSLLGSGNDLPKDGPGEAAVNFFRLLNEGNIEDANDYLYDGYESPEEVLGEQSVQAIQETDYSIEAAEVVAERAEEASVNLTYSAGEDSDTQVKNFGLVRSDTELWVILTVEDR